MLYMKIEKGMRKICAYVLKSQNICHLKWSGRKKERNQQQHNNKTKPNKQKKARCKFSSQSDSRTSDSASSYPTHVSCPVWLLNQENGIGCTTGIPAWHAYENKVCLFVCLFKKKELDLFSNKICKHNTNMCPTICLAFWDGLT